MGLSKAASSGAVHFGLVLGPAVRTLRVAPSPLRPERRGARLVGRNAAVRVSWRPALSAAEDQRRPEVRRWQTQRVEMRAVSPKHNGRTSGREGPRASGSRSWAERKPSGPSQRQAPVPLLRGARLPSPPPPAAGSWAVSLTQAEGSSLPAARAGMTGRLGLAAPSGDPALHRGRASRAARWPPSRRGDGSGAGHLCLWPPLQIKFYWHAATPVFPYCLCPSSCFEGSVEPSRQSRPCEPNARPPLQTRSSPTSAPDPAVPGRPESHAAGSRAPSPGLDQAPRGFGRDHEARGRGRGASGPGPGFLREAAPSHLPSHRLCRGRSPLWIRGGPVTPVWASARTLPWGP